MFQSYHPVHFKPKMLDNLLEQGWFRGGNVMYRSKMLCLEDSVYSVVNIRSNLSEYRFSKSMRKLLNKNNRKFSFNIQALSITPEMELLYKQQSKKFKGFVHSSLENYLYEGMRHNFFNTLELTVYDKEKLVAVSFFDLGKNSIASLMALYDDDYKKYSPGIYTMLMEIQYGLDNGFKYYYPGYIFSGSDLFDYKLKVGNIEYYDWEQWSKFEGVDQAAFPAMELKSAFDSMESLLSQIGLKPRKYLYPYFSLGYANHLDVDFLSSIQFIQLSDVYDFDKMLILSYNCDVHEYVLMEVRDHSSFGFLTNAGFSSDIKNSKAYFQKLLGVEQVIFNCADPHEMQNYIRRFMEFYFRKGSDY